MSERERAIQLLNKVPDYKIEYAIAFLQGMIVGEDIPNEETIAAMEAAEKDEYIYDPFDSVDDLMEALNA